MKIFNTHGINIEKTALNNFLYSGFDFDDREYELRSKFILLNSVVSIGLLVISLLTVFLWWNGKIDLAVVNGLFIVLNVYLLYALRRSENAYKKVIPLILLNGILWIAISLTAFPDEQIRVAWFLIMIMFSYYLGAYRLGISATALSMLALFSVVYFVDTSFNSYTLTLAVTMMILTALFSNLYEKRNKHAREILLRMNDNAQEMIKSKTEKSLDLYKNSTQELIRKSEKLKEQKEVFEHLAYHDILTGLPNRTLFHDRIEHAVEKAKRNKTEFAVLFLDIDRFKEINDTFGHQIGDGVLRIVADRLHEELRALDSIARLGGDEFTVLVEDLNNIYSTEDIAQKLIQVLKDPIEVKGYKFYITNSIGISIYPHDGEDAEVLLESADSAMYAAKRDGGNMHQYHTREMTEQAYERVMLESSIRQAVNNEEFVLHYQPQINTQTGELIGVEALVRWQQPEMGVVFPVSFMPLVEATGLIISLGEWVLHTAATQMTAWQKKGFDPGHIAVNLSVKQLRDESIIAMIENVLRETECKPEWIEFEITESYTMKNPDQSIKLLKRIKEIGVGLAIDDFGTGFSSLSYLKRLPVDMLKIDRSFISDIPGNHENEKLVKTIISMSENLGLEVLAEGVETEEQKLFLQQKGCSNIQGYLYAKPMSADEIAEMFKTKELSEG
ncbi:MAG: EAL domain-containing protein [Campylobacterota bacterium]|nr:EAL domain-containing protein [Campylobacterota bacterium]